jgi:hypothetical protein
MSYSVIPRVFKYNYSFFSALGILFSSEVYQLSKCLPRVLTNLISSERISDSRNQRECK